MTPNFRVLLALFGPLSFYAIAVIALTVPDRTACTGALWTGLALQVLLGAACLVFISREFMVSRTGFDIMRGAFFAAMLVGLTGPLGCPAIITWGAASGVLFAFVVRRESSGVGVVAGRTEVISACLIGVTFCVLSWRTSARTATAVSIGMIVVVWVGMLIRRLLERGKTSGD
jgi:hypothetical protein